MMRNLWFWIAVGEFLILGWIFILRAFRSRRKRFESINVDMNQSKATSVDMDNLIESIHNAKALYKKLSVACHPDRYVDPDLNAQANELFQEITKNQRDFKKLTELKSAVESLLKIKI